MDERLQNLAAEGDVDALFLVLAQDPYVLEGIDQIPFVTTPLHAAAREGKIHFAKEILNLKPSFAWKRDHLGRSPLHLALEGKHLQEGLSPRDSDLEEKYQELVTWLIKHDSELVRVKARGMVTPLHYAAQVDDESSLAAFLYVCPLSIEDLTVRSETAVHIALKNGNFKAFKVLLGWIQRFNEEPILDWEDEEGNNALHTAVSANQPDAVKLLIKCMKVNKKNGKDLTALDIFYDRQGSLDAAVRVILLAAKAKRASEPHRLPLRGSQKNSPVEKYSGGLSFSERLLKRCIHNYPNVDKVPLEVRNVLLVVATLVATTTYQAALSPPGGYWQDDGTNTTKTTTSTYSSTEHIEHRAGKMILSSYSQIIFFIFNSLAFFTSVGLISILIVGLPFSLYMFWSTTWMVAGFYYAIVETWMWENIMSGLFSIFLFVSFVAAHYIPRLFTRQRRELRLDGQQRNLRLGSFEQPRK